MITHVRPADSAGRRLVRGASCDNGEITRVIVNGKDARPSRPNFGAWEVELGGDAADPREIVAHAVDAAGNVETTPHSVRPGSASEPVAARGNGRASNPR